jgi:hypothetical protein
MHDLCHRLLSQLQQWRTTNPTAWVKAVEKVLASKLVADKTVSTAAKQAILKGIGIFLPCTVAASAVCRLACWNNWVVCSNFKGCAQHRDVWSLCAESVMYLGWLTWL